MPDYIVWVMADHPAQLKIECFTTTPTNIRQIEKTYIDQGYIVLDLATMADNHCIISLCKLDGTDYVITPSAPKTDNLPVDNQQNLN